MRPVKCTRPALDGLGARVSTQKPPPGRLLLTLWAIGRCGERVTSGFGFEQRRRKDAKVEGEGRMQKGRRSRHMRPAGHPRANRALRWCPLLLKARFLVPGEDGDMEWAVALLVVQASPGARGLQHGLFLPWSKPSHIVVCFGRCDAGAAGVAPGGCRPEPIAAVRGRRFCLSSGSRQRPASGIFGQMWQGSAFGGQAVDDSVRFPNTL